MDDKTLDGKETFVECVFETAGNVMLMILWLCGAGLVISGLRFLSPGDVLVRFGLGGAIVVGVTIYFVGLGRKVIQARSFMRRIRNM